MLSLRRVGIRNNLHFISSTSSSSGRGWDVVTPMLRPACSLEVWGTKVGDVSAKIRESVPYMSHDSICKLDLEVPT